MHALKEENNFIALYERGELNDWIISYIVARYKLSVDAIFCCFIQQITPSIRCTR
jgi:hypothetical protein